MSILIFGNNDSTTLAAPINSVVTTLTVFPGGGTAFPHPSAGQYFVMTLTPAAGGSTNEIVWVTNVTGDTFTIIRGQEGTTATNWLLGDFASCFPTAGTQAVFVQKDQLQDGYYQYGVAAGTVNALSVTIPSTLTSLTDGMKLALKASGANTTGAVTLQVTLGSTVLSASNVLKANGEILLAGDIPAAGYTVLLTWNATSGAWIMQNPSAPRFSAIVSETRNLSMKNSVAGKTVTITIDELILEAPNLIDCIKLINFSQTLNLNTVGAGGMDVGSPPISGFVAIYAIYNPTTNTTSVLATNSTSVYSNNYYNVGSGNLPAGYVYTALLSVWATDGSGNLIAGYQLGRDLHFGQVNILSISPTLPVSITTISCPIAPLNGVKTKGFVQVLPSAGTGSVTVTLYDELGTIGQNTLSWYAVSPSTLTGTFSEIYLNNLQQFPFSAIGSGITVAGINIYITGYTI